MVKVLLIPLAILAFIVFLIVLGAIGLGIAFLVLATLAVGSGALVERREAELRAAPVSSVDAGGALDDLEGAAGDPLQLVEVLRRPSGGRWCREMYQLEPLSATIRP